MDPCEYEYVDYEYDDDGISPLYADSERCDDPSVGYFNGFFYCEYHAKQRGFL